MSNGIEFNVDKIAPVHLDAPAILTQDNNWMSPFVWKEQNGALAMLVRVVPRTFENAGNTGSIYYGTSRDGLVFKIDDYPVIAPSPGSLDAGGCEDPTVVKWNGEYIVFYTGVDANGRTGRMLYASGRTIDALAKKGIAHASSKTEGNTKEATIERTADGRWRLFYEYAREGASLVGLALGGSVSGPWIEQPAPFAPRSDRWDNWHLSTGPLLTTDPDMPVMFYNGATIDARWRIGWVAFDRDCTQVVKRCVEPLIVPPPPLERDAVDIAFAASIVSCDKHIDLYYSLADRAVFRATIARS